MTELYSNLPEDQSIRLLTILPDEAAADIRCTLEVVDLNRTPHYEALSYVWGTHKPSTRVFCNDFVITVGPNLASALRRLRIVDEARIVWIDAICINQRNLKERSDQVIFMQDIFHKASRVLMWLGDDDDGMVGTALGLIDKAVEHVRRETAALEPRPREIKVEITSTEDNLLRDFPPPQDSSWKALVRLFQRPYLERVWILQEVYHAESTLAMVGNYRKDWVEIGLPVHWFTNKCCPTIIPGFLCLTRVFLFGD